jgi:lysophospholipase
LQSATYIAGLSGGGWLVGSIYSNNFTSVQNIIDQNEDGDIWQLGTSILEGPKTGGIQILSTADYYKNLVDTVTSKKDALSGFNVSLTDYWARALSFQLVNATDGGPAYTWSSIQDDDSFKNGNAPMPMLVALERAPGEKVLSLNATNIEFNPYEIRWIQLFQWRATGRQRLRSRLRQRWLRHGHQFLALQPVPPQH